MAAVPLAAVQQDTARRGRRLSLPFLLTIVLSLPALHPLLLPGFIEGHDGVEHAFRVLALATAWRESGIVGNLLPRWTPNLALGFGYPLFGLYSPLAYVFPAGLTLLGATPITAVKLAVALALLLGGGGTYLCLRPLAGTSGAVAGAITYVYAPYTLANAYVRLDLAELSAGSCAALALAALLRLGGSAETAPARRRIVLAALPLAALPLCHNLSALTFLPLFTSVWGLLLVRSLLGVRRHEGLAAMLPVFGGPLLAAALAAFFLLPAWHWQDLTHLGLLQDDPAFYVKLLQPLALWQHHFALPGWGWFAAGSSWWNFSVAPSPAGEFGAGPSTLAWLAVPASLPLLRPKSRLGGLVAALIIACLLSALLMTTVTRPFWQTMAHLTLLQFPWRFAGPLCLATALLVGLSLTLLPERWRILPAAGCVALAMVPALFYLRPNPVEVPAGAITWPAQLRRELIGGFGTTGSGLFLPRWVPGQSPAIPVFSSPPSGTSTLHLTGLVGRADSFTATYQAQEMTMLTFGAWYFPGWQVRVDGRQLPIAPDASGLLRVFVPAGNHRLAVARRITPVEIAGGIITLAAVLVMIVLLLGPGRLTNALGVGACLGAIGLSGLIPPLAFSALNGLGGAPAWALPALSPPQPRQVAAWRIVRSPVWGATPTLEVVWLTERAPAGNGQATVQVRSVGGAVLAGTTRGLRLGTVSMVGWPAGALIFDHLTIPLPPLAGGPCAGTYTLDLAAGGANAPPTTLGRVALPCAPAAIPAVPQVIASRLHGLGAGRLPVLDPGTTLTLDLSLRVPGPTASDEVLALQLLDSGGQPVAQVQSYGNVDLRFSTLWVAGQTVTYQLRLPLPGTLATGVYTLSLQRFSPAGAAVQPLATASGQVVSKVVLATVKAAPAQAAGSLIPSERFGPSIGLVALAGPPRPELQTQPGATIRVPLRWLAIGTPAADYTAFVHLLDATGTLVAQTDGPPLAGHYPTTAWGRGELIDDTRQLPLPATLPPGRYTVRVGWYLPATGARLPVTPPVPADAAPVADVVVSSASGR